LLDDATTKGNVAAQNELAGVKIPFDNAAQLYYLRKWWFRYDGHPIADKDTTLLKDYIKSWADTWLPAWSSAMERNLLVTLPKVECPVYFFLGGKDYQTNCEIAKSYYELLSAPKKEMYWFDKASHDVLMSDAPKIQHIIINEILAKNDTLSKASGDSIMQLLVTVDANDQKHRNSMDGIREKYGAESKEMKELYDKTRAADSINTIIVSKIIDKYGWLGPKEIGVQGNTTLFFVIQHSDLTIQDRYLPVLKEAVKNGKASATNLALLEDRVALKHGSPQMYGSQVIWNMKDNTSIIAPLSDPDNVDKRRASVGLGPLSDYVSAFGIKWDVEKYKKELPQITAGFFKPQAKPKVN
jgi:hypothetical protein